jgi:hypothetical protein
MFGFCSQGQFGMKLVQSLNPDPKLLAELYPTTSTHLYSL